MKIHTTKNSAILHTYFATSWSTVDFFYVDNNFTTMIGVTNNKKTNHIYKCGRLQ